MSVLALLLTIVLPASVLLLVLLAFLARRHQTAAPSCPSCTHTVHALALPRCPECGLSLEDGVIGAGGISTRRIWATTATLVVGMVVAVGLYGAMTEAWPRALQWMNLSYWVQGGVVSIEVDVDSEHLIRVGTSYASQPGLKEVRSPRVSLHARGEELAAWQSDQTMTANDLKENGFDGGPAMATFRQLIPASHDSSFGALIHDEARAGIFQEAIESFICSDSEVKAHWPDGTGGKLFHGTVGRSISAQRSFVPAPWICELPIYLVPIACFGVFVLVAYRAFWRRRDLVAFEAAVVA